LHEYKAPDRLRLNHWALAGAWTVGEEASTVNRPGGRLLYRFHGRDLHAVLGTGAPVRFQVRLDGQPPGDAHGLDVDADGNGRLTGGGRNRPRRQRGPGEGRPCEIRSGAAGVGVYASPFGYPRPPARSTRIWVISWPRSPVNPGSRLSPCHRVSVRTRPCRRPS